MPVVPAESAVLGCINRREAERFLEFKQM